MEAEFTEFSYGFALSFEIVQSFQMVTLGAPRFPSLLDEGRTGGYDVDFTLVGWPLFLQFKRTEFISRATGYEWLSYGEPYYRMSIRPRKKSSQHAMLKNYATREPDVYYVAPCFWKMSEFDDHFVSQSVFQNSMFFNLRQVPSLPDDKKHYITFLPNTTGFIWHSDNAERFTSSIMGSQLFSSIREHRPEPVVINAGYLLRLRRNLTDIILEHNTHNQTRASDFRGANDPLAKVVSDIRHLLATYFELQMFVIPG